MNEVNQKLPTISVVIPAYNCENTIQSTIESVLTQTFKDFELIIINDGSQDATLDIISQIHDPRIRVFSYPNAGGNVSRNRGLHYAVGEFVSFLDADDIWTPEKLQLQLQALQNNTDAQVAYSWTDYINENGEIFVSGTHITANGDVYEKLLVHNFLENGSNPLICREVLLELGGFDESLQAAQDWDMWLRLAARCSFVAVPSVQILYRVSANSVSTNLAKQEKYCLQVFRNAYCARDLKDKNIQNLSMTNLYKYLTCKALNQPYNRQKGIAAAGFLWKYFINDISRFKRIKFTLKLLLKISIIISLPANLSTNFFKNIKTVN
ncbi:glycosyltransferase [Nodularia sp. UHCC 0506]|uniref:glycosyltransferase n=1 Tax=Nodularia sp. UHCC 0506 TaxID=3110243 RepID=UPI002B201163|nr:glycosyltransferase [Nodularia sp. UHCC 0506]MEA5516414.1 glycosyltransferase [Nodularia sp. UHCC 0506]